MLNILMTNSSLNSPGGDGTAAYLRNSSLSGLGEREHPPMGFLISDDFTTFAGAGSFGHTGAGGSIAFAQPERELAFAYVMNKMSEGLAGYSRANGLIEAAVVAADASA